MGINGFLFFFLAYFLDFHDCCGFHGINICSCFLESLISIFFFNENIGMQKLLSWFCDFTWAFGRKRKTRAMATRVTQTPLIIQDENLGVSRKSIPRMFFVITLEFVWFLYPRLRNNFLFFLLFVEAGFDGSVKQSKTATKKSGGFALGNRKALNDITNKAVVRQETSSRKKKVQKEEINNVAEERFLHDHNKCIEEKEATSISSFLDLVLPGPGNYITICTIIMNIAQFHFSFQPCESSSHQKKT